MTAKTKSVRISKAFPLTLLEDGILSFRVAPFIIVSLLSKKAVTLL